ncbi:MAG: hypothetical protein RBR02_06275 [Desulfuromonadaceae bacterium]|nr:hypothetical protein [Desulfuromonadaceae bacterium]
MIKLKNKNIKLYYEKANQNEDFYYTLYDSKKRFLTNIYEKEVLKELETFNSTMENLFALIGEEFNYYSDRARHMFEMVMLDDLNNQENVYYLLNIISNKATFESELLTNDYINVIEKDNVKYYIFVG